MGLSKQLVTKDQLKDIIQTLLNTQSNLKSASMAMTKEDIAGAAYSMGMSDQTIHSLLCRLAENKNTKEFIINCTKEMNEVFDKHLEETAKSKNKMFKKLEGLTPPSIPQPYMG